jgi:hypothetical protein
MAVMLGCEMIGVGIPLNAGCDATEDAGGDVGAGAGDADLGLGGKGVSSGLRVRDGSPGIVAVEELD